MGCTGQGGQPLAARQHCERVPRDPVTAGWGQEADRRLGGVCHSTGHSASGGLAAMHGSGPW